MSLTPFLMFQGGTARAAVELYTSAIPDAHVVALVPADAQPGLLTRSRIRIQGQDIDVLDSPVDHAFGFTPALSLFLEVDAAEFDAVCAALSAGGSVLMEPGAYPFAQRYAWFDDRFGVSWQLAVREGRDEPLSS